MLTLTSFSNGLRTTLGWIKRSTDQKIIQVEFKIEEIHTQLQSDFRQAMSKVEQALQNCQGQLDILHARFAGIEELSSNSGGKVLSFLSDLETCTRSLNALEKKMNLHIDFSEAQIGEIKNQFVMFKTSVAEEIEHIQQAHENIEAQIDALLNEPNTGHLSVEKCDQIFERLDKIEANNDQILRNLSESVQSETRRSKSSRVIEKIVGKIGHLEKDLEVIRTECRLNGLRSETTLNSKISKLRKMLRLVNSPGMHSKSTCK